MESLEENEFWHRTWNGFLIFLGFWLSPLSPWNDVFTNIPMAYVFGLPFSLIHESLFLPAVIVGYWLSNLLGFLLMHYGYVQLKETQYSFKKHWVKYVLITTLYTLIIAVLIYTHVLPSAQDITTFFVK